MRIGVDLVKDVQGAIQFFFFGACQEKYITLHTVDVYSRSDLDVGIGSSGSFEVLFIVVLTDI